MTTTAVTEPYVDLYLLPVRRERLGEYETQAASFGAIAREHGALSYREVLADDPGDNLTVEAGLVMTAAVVEFEDRAHRDAVMAAVLADPRVGDMTAAEGIAEMSRMTYGGFAPFVTA